MKKIKKFIGNYLDVIVVLTVVIISVIFLIVGHKSENGSITLDGGDAKIEDYTKNFIEDANAALNRLMNDDKPTDEKTIEANDEEATGQGFYTTIEDIINRRLKDGDKDGGKGWQCSKYTGYLATGKRQYSTAHPDYGPVNGKAITDWLVKNYGFKYISTPVKGAIGSGGFNTQYGHTVMYLYSTGTNKAMVNDANYVPLTVGTHEMNISGWKWVVPGSYNPTPKPTPTPTPQPTPTPSDDKGEYTYTVKSGDTLGAIIRAYGYTGNNLYGDNGVAQKVADLNKLQSRGLIYPGQTITIKKELF